jgi:hypothetical protein
MLERENERVGKEGRNSSHCQIQAKNNSLKNPSRPIWSWTGFCSVANVADRGTNLEAFRFQRLSPWKFVGSLLIATTFIVYLIALERDA